MAMSLPRTARISAFETFSRLRPSKRISPATIFPGGATKRMMDSAVIDLPQPLSPTSPSSSPRSSWKLTPCTAHTNPSRV
jgi:hypothetical protein